MSGVTAMPPMMPVRMDGDECRTPPSASVMPIATLAVTDFGASATNTGLGAPNGFEIRMARCFLMSALRLDSEFIVRPAMDMLPARSTDFSPAGESACSHICSQPSPR
jgi:hypothetical protein